jgi:TolB-like protein/Flp pilus assembly protein TadD
MGQLFQELKRRNVIRVAIAYAVLAWLLIEVTSTIFPILSLPKWSVTLVTVLIFIGFPIALIFAWAFELTPDGIKLEKQVVREESITHATGRKLDFGIIALLVLGLGYFAYDKFVLDPSRDAELVQSTTKAVTEQVTNSAKSENPDKSIAVLAFADLSPEGDQEYFADGVSEEILNLLAQVPELRVTSRSSAFSFKEQNLDVPTMAARLNVAHVLEGSVRKSGNQLRITAQLIEAGTDTHLWSQTYDRQLADIFAVQDEIAAAVVDALKITLLGGDLRATETDTEAYALYLQARSLMTRVTVESFREAERRLNEALAIDPGFAPAWSELGALYWWQANRFVQYSLEQAVHKARRAIGRALEIDPRYGRAHQLLGILAMRYDYDFATASWNLRRAREFNPGDSSILETLARLNEALGRLDEAISLMHQSVALDPVSSNAHYVLGRMLYRAKRLEEAADSFQTALSLNPEQWGAWIYSALVELAEGNAQAALVTLEKENIHAFRLYGTALIQHELGNAEASNRALQELIEIYEDVAAYQVAGIYAFRGESDNAFEWMQKAYNLHAGGLINLLLHPTFVSLHDDPRWEPFLDKMGLPY